MHDGCEAPTALYHTPGLTAGTCSCNSMSVPQTWLLWTLCDAFAFVSSGGACMIGFIMLPLASNAVYHNPIVTGCT